jgi:hypothetical protein
MKGHVAPKRSEGGSKQQAAAAHVVRRRYDQAPRLPPSLRFGG